MSRTRTLSVHTEHELLLKLEQGGLTDDIAQKIITARGNNLAKCLVQIAQNGGLPIPSNGSQPAKENLPVAAFMPHEFVTWKRIKLGTHKDNAALSQAITDGGGKISKWGGDILSKTPVATELTELDLVLVTVGELGFKNGAKRSEIYDKAISLGLSLCPAEVGPQLRLQYTDQPRNEWVLVAMEPIVDSHDVPDVFSVGHDDVDRWLYVDFGSPDYFWRADYLWVFCRK